MICPKVFRRLGIMVFATVVSLSCMPLALEAETLDPDILNQPVGGLAIRTPPRPMELLSSADARALDEQMSSYRREDDSLLKNKASRYYYYERLDPTAMQIYDVMYEVCRDPVSTGNIGLVMTDQDPEGEEFYHDFGLAYRAICFDHPELFWLYSGEEANIGYYSEAINQNGFYFVYFKMVEPFENFEEQMTRFNSAADAFLADIDTGISEYDTILQIHDKLIGMVNYNDPVAESISFFSLGQDLAHTAYGALVEDSSQNPHYAVCDGYSLAFEYLLQQCGIDAVFIGGMAGPGEDALGGHAWNVVKLDGVWYEVDSTWDDAGSNEDDVTPGTDMHGYLMEMLNDPAYRQKIDHYLFLVSTERISDFPSGEEYEYLTSDQMHVFNLCDKSLHIRMSDYQGEDEENPDAEIIATAPVSMQSYRQ